VHANARLNFHGRRLLVLRVREQGRPIRATRASGRRYEHREPGDLVHVDVKKLGRVPEGGGWRAHGRGARPNHKRRIGFDYIHAMVDDHSRLAYAEVLPDEKGATCAGFLTRAAAVFAAAGIPRIDRVLTDNARNYRGCAVFAQAVTELSARQKFIRPHCPWTNGKVCEDCCSVLHRSGLTPAKV
jgi:integrase-like protein